MKKFIGLGGLPRSGSTLLCNLLWQNPEFFASQTSACLDVLFSIRNTWDGMIEHKSHPMPQSKINVLQSVLEAYYKHVDRRVIFDKSRGWLAYLELLEEILGEKAKVLVCIRRIPDVLASLEKLNRETSKIRQPPGEAQNYFQFQSQEGRCEYWLRNDNLVGLAYTRIRDAIQRGLRDRLHFVHYEDLTASPMATMRDVYTFLGEPYFEHDFNNIAQVTDEDDSLHGYVNLHKIYPKIMKPKNDAVAILGDNLVKKYSNFNLY